MPAAGILPPHDDAPPPELDPADALRLMAGTDEAVRRSLRVDARSIYAAWGAAWAVSYVAFFLAHRPGGSPAGWAFAVLGLTSAAAMTLTIITSVRASRGLRGASSRIGRLMGTAWYAAFIGAYGMLGLSFSHTDAPAVLASYLYALAPVLVVGIIYAAGGAMAGDGVMSVLGAWLCLVAAVAAAAAMPWAYLVVAALGGGGFLVAAVAAGPRRLRIPNRGR